MSYTIQHECENGCSLKDKCNDRHFLEGAVQGIHSVFPSEKGHLGSGTIKLECQNWTGEKTPE